MIDDANGGPHELTGQGEAAIPMLGRGAMGAATSPATTPLGAARALGAGDDARAGRIIAREVSNHITVQGLSEDPHMTQSFKDHLMGVPAQPQAEGEELWPSGAHRHWRVTVETGADQIVCIETECLSGRELSEADEATIRQAALHLLSFIGNPAQPVAQEPVTVGIDLASGPDQTAVTLINPTQAALDVLAERQRQISAEGWTPEHDDAHVNGNMALAAATYAVASTYPETALLYVTPPYHIDNIRRIADLWPWETEWWKPGPSRRMLVKSGALILAELERLDRAASVGGEVKG